MIAGCCIHRAVRWCRRDIARHHVGQKQGPARWHEKHIQSNLYRGFGVSPAAQPEPCAQQTAIDWAKRPEGGRPVRQFLEDKRKQPRKPKLEQGVERLSKVHKRILCSSARACCCKASRHSGSLQVVAATGVATYKKAHAVILAGRVKVNGRVVKEPTHLVNPTADEIYIHGSLVEPRQQHRYMILNKLPSMPCSTLLDRLHRNGCEPSARNDTSDAESGGMVHQKLFLAGRLDSETCGLQLITTDADWADRVARSAEGMLAHGTCVCQIHIVHPPRWLPC